VKPQGKLQQRKQHHQINISLVLFSPGSAEADIGCGGILSRHFMASCARGIPTRHY